MKRQLMRRAKGYILLIITVLFNFKALAQDKISLEDSAWYTQPWVWLLSGGIFILIFAIILNNDQKDA